MHTFRYSTVVLLSAASIFGCGAPSRRAEVAEQRSCGDTVAVFYGIKLTITAEDDDDLEAYEDESHETIQRARAAQLDTYFGRLTEGEPHFLLIGKELSVVGVEHDPAGAVSDPELNRIVSETRRRLLAAGFTQQPALLLQLDAEH